MKIKVFLCGMAILLWANDVLAVEVSFKDLKSLVEENNSRLKAQRFKLEAAQSRKGALTRSFLPRVDVTGGYESFEKGASINDEQPYYGVETEINIFNGGQDKLQSDIYNLQSERQRNETKVMLATELSRARELFWKIVYYQKELRLLETMQAINEKNLKSANKRIRSGVATPSDRLEFEMKKLDLKRDYDHTLTLIKVLKTDLGVSIGLSHEEDLAVKADLTHADEWEQDLKHTHDDHQFFTKPSEILAEELMLKKQKKQRAWTPKLDLYAGWYQLNQRKEESNIERERQETAIGLKLTMNIFNGLQTYNDSRVLSLQANAATAESEHQKQKSEAHIEKEFLELKSLHDQVHDAEKHISLAQKYYNVTQSEYSRGAKNSPDVLGAAEKLESVTRKKNQLLRDFHIARSHVLSKIGK